MNSEQLYQMQEWMKCAKDILYFLNTYGNAFNIKTQQIEPLKCFDYQEKTVLEYENYKNNIILKSRQMGLSVITSGYVAWKLLFGVDERILIVANDGAGAIRFLKSVKQFLDLVPKFLLPEKRIKDNEKYVEFSNGCFAKAVASSEQAGRGESLTLLIMDEVAFIDNAETIWMGAGLALAATGGKCIMISTPNGSSGLYHDTWVGSKRGENDFNRITIHWTQHPKFSEGMYLKQDSMGRDVNSSPWYEQECARMNYDSVKIAQELDLSFEGSKYLVIPNEIVESYERQLINKNPLCYYDFRTTMDFSEFETPFWIWEKPITNKNYIVSCDVARGDAADYSTIQVIEADECKQVAELQLRIPPDLFAELIYKVGMLYNTAYVVVECNSFGLATALHLKNQLKYPYKKLNHVKSNTKIFNRTHGYFADENEEIPGFQTTTKTRPLIINSLHKYMREGVVKINSTRLLDEFKTFVYNNDKPGHEKNSNDDLIFALGIALFIRDTEFENVAFNIDQTRAMLNAFSRVVVQTKNVNVESNFNNARPVQNIQKNSQNGYQNSNDDAKWLL
jgi:hypothetical protein